MATSFECCSGADSDNSTTSEWRYWRCLSRTAIEARSWKKDGAATRLSMPIKAVTSGFGSECSVCGWWQREIEDEVGGMFFTVLF
ncbi:hypothetical protein DEO72_LG8g2112 [Vigna unguiculata]|uniref:Uncharacterized protein n=1 Tax=Vigna unguiculata TaxID=3917 RepID=A0A4D6MVF4_VIGUN|nr:hypothetical protein DEO72_LG8g2112 [Vigna unguiculata]